MSTIWNQPLPRWHDPDPDSEDESTADPPLNDETIILLGGRPSNTSSSRPPELAAAPVTGSRPAAAEPCSLGRKLRQ